MSKSVQCEVGVAIGLTLSPPRPPATITPVNPGIQGMQLHILLAVYHQPIMKGNWT